MLRKSVVISNTVVNRSSHFIQRSRYLVTFNQGFHSIRSNIKYELKLNSHVVKSCSIIAFKPPLNRANIRIVRNLSSKPPKPSGGDKSSSTGNGENSSEMILTPGQKVVAGTRLTLWGGAFCFAAACAFFIGKELMPTKMSPNRVFDKAVGKVTEHPEVIRRFGAQLKAYGRDHGGHREGRRNFIEHTEYNDKDDGSKRVRVRFNLEGKHGNAFVFAEVSNDMASGEFVYVVVQDKQNGHVITVVDNRSSMIAQRLAGGNKSGQEAFANLLGKRG